ncbi:MAG TPA: HAD family phosphatase [Parachlamydiaceae bacterium]|nr:HAD family phosphatase [Parachlamydiaceae bacterium]
MMNKLVIFDCDGVLVDSEIISNRIDAEALTAFGYPITVEESIRRFTGMNAKAVRQIILNESGINIPLDNFLSLEPIVLKAFGTELVSLIKPVLEFTENRKISRCVASSSQRNRVVRSLELTEQFMYFNDQSIFTSQQVSNGKPAPDLFLFAADKMGFTPEDCIVIEDSFAGIEAALSAGMRVIGFLGGSHAHYQWYQEKIHAYNIPIARNCNELLKVLSLYED